MSRWRGHDQGPKAARRFTKRFARPGYTERQGYLATPFTRDDMVAILRDIYRGFPRPGRVAPPPPITCIIEGEAQGIDRKARKWAEARGVPFEAYPVTPAEWDARGKRRGSRSRPRAPSATGRCCAKGSQPRCSLSPATSAPPT